MDFLSIREIIKRKIIKMNGRPVTNHNTIKTLLALKDIQPIKKGNRLYYEKDDVYEKLKIDN